MDRDELVARLHADLEVEKFKDYCPNGLQVEGRRDIRTLVSGVTASLALIERAVELRADALLVHHGLFWRGQAGTVTGWMRKRLGLLLEHDINVLAYHLPLDAHGQWGNNVQLGHRLGLCVRGRFGEQQLGCWGELDRAFVGMVQGIQIDTSGRAMFATVQSLADHVAKTLGRTVVLVKGGDGPIERVGWCTGGAQGYFEAAIGAGVQVFITGEISEPQAHLARECGVSYISCGHHASERYGVAALGEALAQQHGLSHWFVDLDNPA